MGRKLAAIYPVGNRDERSFIPKRIWVVWPQFFLDTDLPNDSESLFEAVRETTVDLLGRTGGMACAKPEHELSRFVLEEGFFDTRDEALKRLGSLQRTLRGRWFEAFFGYRKSS